MVAGDAYGGPSVVQSVMCQHVLSTGTSSARVKACEVYDLIHIAPWPLKLCIPPPSGAKQYSVVPLMHGATVSAPSLALHEHRVEWLACSYRSLANAEHPHTYTRQRLHILACVGGVGLSNAQFHAAICAA